MSFICDCKELVDKGPSSKPWLLDIRELCSGQWHGLSGPSRSALPTTNSPVPKSVCPQTVITVVLPVLYIWFAKDTYFVRECVCIWGVEWIFSSKLYLFVPENPNIIMSTSYGMLLLKGSLYQTKFSGENEIAFNCCDNYLSIFVGLSECSREEKRLPGLSSLSSNLSAAYRLNLTPLCLSQNWRRCWETDQFLTVCTWLLLDSHEKLAVCFRV